MPGFTGPVWSRRRFLVTAGLATSAAALGACGVGGGPQLLGPNSPVVGELEQRRRSRGAKVRDFSLTAAAMTVRLAGMDVTTSGYDQQLPGRELRLTAGEVLRVNLANELNDPTTIHWHGLALRNDMDGVPDVTQPPIPAGTAFAYEFVAPHPGTYWYHPHVGMQLDRGLYGPLVVDDPAEPGDYDREVVLMLDDWTDGVGESPEAIVARLQAEGMDMGEMSEGMEGMSEGGMGSMGGMMGGGDSLVGGDAGDVMYPMYLVNGRDADDPFVIDARPGERLRLRVINAGGDTAFRFAVGGHEMRVTHTDGFPVTPVSVEAFLIGMGERYDVIVTVGDGVFPVVALAEGKDAQAVAVIKTASGSMPPSDVRPEELDGKVLTLDELRATDEVSFGSGTPDRIHDVDLTVNPMDYRWFINGRTFDEREPLRMKEGERIRLRFNNMTGMFHPMHLHGHTFQVNADGGGPRKDTLVVKPGETLSVDFLGDNPGDWLMHCHNLYHGESGMMTTVVYEA